MGSSLIGYLGRYGDSNINWFPAFVDEGVVIGFGLVVYYVALASRLEPNGVSEEVAKDAHQLAGTRRADHGLRRDDAVDADHQTVRIHRVVRLAVAVGFEPTVGLHPHTLSRRAP